MADINDLIKKLQGIKQKLPDVALKTATSISLAAKALAERTIRDQGFGALYSLRGIPAFLLEGKELSQRGKKFIEAKMKADEYVAWSGLRQAEGLQIGFVDLAYSNEMWRGMFPRQAVEKQPGKFIAPLGHNNQDGQNKMNWNRARYGDFIGKVLTGDNFEAMVTVAREEFTRFLDQEFSTP